LGVRTEIEPSESADMVDEVGFGFYYQPEFNPGIDALFERRDNMGVRTFVNTVETLANPANASVHLGSFYHLAFAKKMVRTLKESETSTVERALFFQGMEGYDDVRPGETVVAEWPVEGSDSDEEDIADFEIRTGEYGMDVTSEDLQVEEVAADSAAITEQVLTGERADGFADAVALNAALRIYARADADSIEAGLEQARAAIDDGSAADALDSLREF
jgi:anthranilate phosphoribosyltransferase